eukprot:gnl/Chilomastix_caulleri/3140.p1 GENE.gnl/Chilomastix_caulleri/3140~~gnl/Chilomastix_caulleri/3140.p1  ORF type:complete len:124 (+),score=41.98 gnl/Chilomastix_caulleri/3140:151-522(+)
MQLESLGIFTSNPAARFFIIEQLLIHGKASAVLSIIDTLRDEINGGSTGLLDLCVASTRNQGYDGDTVSTNIAALMSAGLVSDSDLLTWWKPKETQRFGFASRLRRNESFQELLNGATDPICE